MIASLRIEEFRCFKELSIKGLSRINLIGGKNNVGKTAFLEALFLLEGLPDLHSIERLSIFRGLGTTVQSGGQTFSAAFEQTYSPNYLVSLIEQSWRWIFPHFDPSRPVIIESDQRKVTVRLLSDSSSIQEYISGHQGNMKPVMMTLDPVLGQRIQSSYAPTHLLVVDIQKPGFAESYGAYIQNNVPVFQPYSTFSGTVTWFFLARNIFNLAEDADRFGKLVVTKNKEKVIRILKNIEPRLVDLEIVPLLGSSVLHADIGEKNLIPLPLLGDGMMRVANLANLIASNPGCRILFDEFENGLHHSVLKKLWKDIGQVALDFDVQLFATTHSWECAQAAHDAFAEGENEAIFSYFRLEQKNESHRLLRYEPEVLASSLEQNLEIR